MIPAAISLAAILFFGSPARAEQKTYIGAESCRQCHPAQFARQSVSGHARSLYKAGEHPLAGGFASVALERPPTYRLQFLVDGGRSRFHADDGRYVTEAPVEWAFGAGYHAVTFLGRVSSGYYLELSLSYFADVGSFDLTPRHDLLPLRTLNDALGQPVKTRTAGVACFSCHSTGPVAISSSGEITIAERGVRCESCHGPGAAHRAAGLAGKSFEAKKLIGNPGALSPVALNGLCGRCHRATEDLREVDWQSPWSVRHQPPYLGRSRCFQASGKLSCLTCHDPHDQARRNDSAYYRAKCIACHRSDDHTPKPVCQPDCIRCHMPTVAAGPHLQFVNHWIGIYTTSPLMPVRVQ